MFLDHLSLSVALFPRTVAKQHLFPLFGVYKAGAEMRREEVRLW